MVELVDQLVDDPLQLFVVVLVPGESLEHKEQLGLPDEPVVVDVVDSEEELELFLGLCVFFEEGDCLDE